MLPPPPVTAIENNTHLADLYEFLTSNILASDGSTESTNEAYIETHEELRAARQNALQEQILLRALTDLTLTESAQQQSQLSRSTSTPEVSAHPILDPEQQDLIHNISSYLLASLKPPTDSTQPLPQDTEELMSAEISAFRNNLDAIASALSAHLTALHTTLSDTAATLFPSPNSQPTPATRLHLRSAKPQPAQQPQPLSTTLTTTSTTSTSLLSTHLPSTLSTTLSTLHASQTTHTHALTSAIRTLELTTHGSHARYTTARANYLSSVSRGIALKARILRLEREREIYGDASFVAELEGEVEKCGVEERRLEKRERELCGLLEEYEGAGREVVNRTTGVGVEDSKGEKMGEDVFRVLGTRYAEVEGEIERVKRDIEKLQTQVYREKKGGFV